MRGGRPELLITPVVVTQLKFSDSNPGLSNNANPVSASDSELASVSEAARRSAANKATDWANEVQEVRALSFAKSSHRHRHFLSLGSAP